ncbi:O-antigen ligase family protein [Ureibacillus acetophenoni]|uniref:O-antigen ligase family protein n=1 Tax=Ureibacillus acetophenoni TaxID=614649 RepID=UPI001142E967|nr:O-antigen ligase family protein [Ureibacillus acetophenoni]
MQNNLRIPNFTVFLLLFVITLSRYHLYLGFSLKIYMIFLVVLFCIYLKYFFFRPLFGYEVVLLIFYFFYCLSGVFSEYPSSSIRILLGVVIVLGSYFIMKFLFERISITSLEITIANAGLIFNGMSLVWYIAGILITDGSVDTISFGLLIDRDYPRLIGLLDDPNIYVFFNTLFFCFYVTNLKGVKHYSGFLLCLITSLLTFSRGGLVSLLLVSVLYLVLSSSAKRIKWIGLFLPVIGVIYAVSYFTPININRIIINRINDFTNDQGSGRFELWEQALDYFMSKPLLGIGAFNFSDYYAFHHHKTLYVHNTYLEILAESGILGFTLFLLFLIVLMKKFYEIKLHKTKPYIVLTFFGFLFQMISLSLIINEAFFLFLAISARYFEVYEEKIWRNKEQRW